MDFEAFARSIGISFTTIGLLAEALTHRSYLNENRDSGFTAHNERLEFLGDAVLELAVTRFLFEKFPAKPEGDLTAYRAALVNTGSIAEAAAALGVNSYILLSKGEAKDTGRARETILANAFEAIIGAIYLDQGYDAAERFIATHIYGKLDAVIESRAFKDAKSAYQEFAQEHRGLTPVYRVLAQVGPDHARTFTVGVYVGADEMARGEGRSKQEAEQAAAQNALGKGK